MKNYLFTLLFLLSACITPGKVSTYLEKPKHKAEADVIVTQYMDKNEALSSLYCATRYPISESTDTKTETEKGNTDALKSELQKAEAEADSLLNELNSLPVKDDCKPEALARDKVIRTLQNRIASLNQQATTLRADVERVTTTRTEESTAEATKWRLKFEAEQKARIEVQAQKDVLQQDYKDVKKQLTRAYMFGGLLIVAAAGLLFLLFKK